MRKCAPILSLFIHFLLVFWGRNRSRVPRRPLIPYRPVAFGRVSRGTPDKYTRKMIMCADKTAVDGRETAILTKLR